MDGDINLDLCLKEGRAPHVAHVLDAVILDEDSVGSVARRELLSRLRS